MRKEVSMIVLYCLQYYLNNMFQSIPYSEPNKGKHLFPKQNFISEFWSSLGNIVSNFEDKVWALGCFLNSKIGEMLKPISLYKTSYNLTNMLISITI